MSERRDSNIRRREFLRALGIGTTLAATSAGLPRSEARADAETDGEKRSARYKADSLHIQNFYRVNRYPTQ